MKRTVTERYDEAGKLIERVTVEENDAPAAPTGPYTYPSQVDYWWMNPVICTSPTMPNTVSF